MYENLLTIAITERRLFEGMKIAAFKEGKGVGEYVMELIKADLVKRCGYKIVEHYDDGTSNETTDIYSKIDLDECVAFVEGLYLSGTEIYDNGVIITGYDVYEHGELIGGNK
jgi:hypothetical protein